MIAYMVNTDGSVNIHYKPFDPKFGFATDENEVLEKGWRLAKESDIPQPENNDKAPILKYSETDGFYYEYFDIPLTQEQRVEQLEKQLVEQQEQFRLELAESNTQMFEMMMTMQGGIV